jgi:hypothetical protein
MMRNFIKNILFLDHTPEIVSDVNSLDNPYFVYLVEQLEKILVPISPTHEFRLNLKQELLASMRQRQANQLQQATPPRILLMVAAVVGFLVSVAGILFARRWSNQIVLSSP